MFTLPPEIVFFILMKLEFYDLIHASQAHRVSRDILKNSLFWKQYIRRFNLNELSVLDPFWDSFQMADYKYFCKNHANISNNNKRTLPKLTMLHIVLMSDNIPLLEKYCNEKNVKLDSVLLEVAALCASAEVLYFLVEEKNILITQRAMLLLFERNDSNIINLAIVWMHSRGTCDNPLYRNNREIYYREIVRGVAVSGSKVANQRLIKIGLQFRFDEFIYIVPQIRIEQLGFLIDLGAIPCNNDLMNQCAFAGRYDLVSFLVDIKMLVPNDITLKCLVYRGTLHDVQHFIETMQVYPSSTETLTSARKNADYRVSEYINLLLNTHTSVLSIMHN